MATISGSCSPQRRCNAKWRIQLNPSLIREEDCWPSGLGGVPGTSGRIGAITLVYRTGTLFSTNFPFKKPDRVQTNVANGPWSAHIAPRARRAQIRRTASTALKAPNTNGRSLRVMIFLSGHSPGRSAENEQTTTSISQIIALLQNYYNIYIRKFDPLDP